jgi:DeoR family transcriptional regulator, suf operon transcriptional repressor
MQSTKQQILVLLKRAGSATIEEAAAALAIASMTARQHLVGLEKDGLVQAEKVKRATGRPHYLFRLTAKGEEMFPRRYDLLAQLLLEEIGRLNGDDLRGLGPAEKRSLMIDRVADRIVASHRLQTEGVSLAERVSAVTELLHTVGGFAEWYDNGESYEIRDYNCVFAHIAPESESGCEWHASLLSRLLGQPLVHQIYSNGGARCCRYLVRAAEGEGTETQ